VSGDGTTLWSPVDALVDAPVEAATDAPIDAAADPPIEAAADPSADAVPGPATRARALAWGTTVFRAACDAAEGVAWPREGASPCGVWRTQLSRLDEAARTLGIQAGAAERTREQVAVALGVPQLVLEAAGRSFAQARGYRARGEVVVAILDRVAGDCVCERLLRCALVAGRWDSVVRWDPGRPRPRRAVFRRSGTGVSDRM
jgi:hypothetical protein